MIEDGEGGVCQVRARAAEAEAGQLSVERVPPAQARLALGPCGSHLVPRSPMTFLSVAVLLCAARLTVKSAQPSMMAKPPQNRSMTSISADSGLSTSGGASKKGRKIAFGGNGW